MQDVGWVGSLTAKGVADKWSETPILSSLYHGGPSDSKIQGLLKLKSFLEYSYVSLLQTHWDLWFMPQMRLSEQAKRRLVSLLSIQSFHFPSSRLHSFLCKAVYLINNCDMQQKLQRARC